MREGRCFDHHIWSIGRTLETGRKTARTGRHFGRDHRSAYPRSIRLGGDRRIRQEDIRVIVAHEDPISYGYGAEIAARISDELFEYLDAPVRRVGATDTFVAYAPKMEDAILPQVADVEEAVRELMRY